MRNELVFKVSKILIVMFVLVNLIGCSTEKETSSNSNINQMQPTPTPSPSPTVLIDFSSVDVNENNIKLAVEHFFGNLKSVGIEEKNGLYTIDLTYYGKEFLSAEALKKGLANVSVNAMEVLFKNPKVGKVWVWVESDMTDSKGNTNAIPVANVALTKENAKTINWDEFKFMVIGDYNALFKIADSNFIHPSLK